MGINYEIGIVAPRHEDLYTFQDLNFRLPSVAHDETLSAYKKRCEAALAQKLAKGVRGTFLDAGLTRIKNFHARSHA